MQWGKKPLVKPFPWRNMEIGDTFLIEAPQDKASALCAMAKRRMERSFSVHQVKHLGQGVWLIEIRRKT